MIKGSAITLDLHGRIEMHDDLYVSFCDELPLVGVGTTSEDAMGSFITCLKEYMRLIYESDATEGTAIRWNQHPTTPSGEFSLSLPKVVGEREMPVGV
jgi:hypothetical protein